MPKTKISDFSTTAGNNTDINSINIAEGCAPSGINDAIRTLMAYLKDWQSGAVAQDNSFNGAVTISGNAVLSANLTVAGNATLGDASGDSVTFQASTVATPNGLNFDSNTFVIDATNNRIGLSTTTPPVALSVVATDAILIPKGTTGERPTGTAGYIRYNSTLGKFEGYGTAWGALGGGATGGGADEVFYENGQTVNTDYTITTNKSAMSAGPITIASGVTVTIPSGSRWVIV
jgi:hypothetical protein